MKKMIFLMVLSFLGITTGMNAQVTIGSAGEPHKGAILDLSQGSTESGLLLPHVSITNVKDFKLPTDGTSTKANALGMVVYNTNPALGEGLYTWNGTEWKSVSNGSSGSCTPLTATSISSKSGNNAKLKVEVSAGTVPVNYTWYKSGINGSVRTVSNTTATSDTYITAAAGTYTCQVVNACTTTPASFAFIVSADGSSEQYVDNGNGTYTNKEGDLVIIEKDGTKVIYKRFPCDVPGFYTDKDGEIVYVGADGIPGTADDDTFVTLTTPIKRQNTLFSISYPSWAIEESKQYSITLDYADPADAGQRSVVKYLSSDLTVLTVSNAGEISVLPRSASNLTAGVLVLLDDGSVAIKEYSNMTTGNFNSGANNFNRIIGADVEVLVNSIKVLSTTDHAVNGSGNIYDTYTINYAITADPSGTGSSLSPSGWFVAGPQPGTVTVTKTVNVDGAGTITSDPFYVYVRGIPSAESSYETSFSGNWMDLEAAPSYAGGSGSGSDPYLISSVRQLKKLSSDVNRLGVTDATYEKYFKLTTDLDFNGATVPNHLIDAFQGTFDGGEHVINNLNINVTDGTSSGIFSSIGYATLKNLGRTGGQTTGNGVWVAGLVASARQSTITDCFNTTPLTGMAVISGIVGSFYESTLNNCYNTGNLISTVPDKTTYSGGLIAAIGGEGINYIKNSYNAGNITTSQMAGGLIGNIFATPDRTVEIENSFNFGTITSEGNDDRLGAIIGTFASNTFSDLIVLNVHSTPGILYKNGSTLITPDRMIGYTSGANKTNVEKVANDNVAQMNADAKYSEAYSQSSSFVSELGSAFKYANGRTPKLAWEK